MPTPLSAPRTHASDLPPLTRRLIVLIPDTEVDETELAQTIWSLAAPRGLKVLFLGLCANPATEFAARRRLATLAAITRDRQVHVETRLKFEPDWLEAVREIWSRDDLIICHTEQTLPGWGLGRESLGWKLVSKLRAPVYILKGFYPALPRPTAHAKKNRTALTLSLITMVVFFGLQAWVDQGTKNSGWLNTGLLSGLIVIELGLIWVWNGRGFSDE